MSEVNTESQNNQTMQETLDTTGNGAVLDEQQPARLSKKQQRKKQLESGNNNNNTRKSEPPRSYTLDEASSRCSKYLFCLTKPNNDCTSPHVQLFKLIVRHLLDAQSLYIFNVDEDLSALAPLYNTCSSLDMYSCNKHLQSYLSDLLPRHQVEHASLNQYRLLLSFAELVNRNILNYSVYVDKKNISKYRLFDIIETTLFTQVFPTEFNFNKIAFKRKLANDINELRQSLIQANYRGLGKSRKNTTQSNNQQSVDNNTVSSSTDNDQQQTPVAVSV